MIFGMSYAAYVAIVVGTLAFADNTNPTPADLSADGYWFYGFGGNDPDVGHRDRSGEITVEYRPNDALFLGLRPLYAAGVAGDGGGFLSIGVRRDYFLGAFQITPYTGPALYRAPDDGDDEGAGWLQFRTGFDVMYEVAPDVSVSAGFYHLSDATASSSSADRDVVRMGLQYRF